MDSYNRRTLYSIVENEKIIKTDVLWRLFPDRLEFMFEEPSKEFLDEHNLVRVNAELTYDKNTKTLKTVEPYLIDSKVYNKVIIDKKFIPE